MPYTLNSKLEKLLGAIESGRTPSILLLHGDDYLVREASQEIVDRLIPIKERTLNLERYDGTLVKWEQIETSLMTAPLLPGKKVFLIENAPYFFSLEKKGDLVEKVKQLWSEEKREEAAVIFLDLLVLEGWTQEQWEKAQDTIHESNPVASLESGKSAIYNKELDALFDFCYLRGMDLSRHQFGKHNEVAQLMKKGLPHWAILLMTAVHVDRRTRLYRELDKLGGVLNLELDRERSGRINPSVLKEFLDRRLKEVGKQIEFQAKEMIIVRAGGQLWFFQHELEKLLLYVGDNPIIGTRAVQEVFLDQSDAWVFDLTNSMVRRDVLQALTNFRRLLSQGEHPLRLINLVAGQVRHLLLARHLIKGDMRHRWYKEMTFNQFQKAVIDSGTSMLKQHIYREFMAFQDAENFTTTELLGLLEKIYRTDIRLKSSTNNPRLVMEGLIFEMCQGSNPNIAIA